MMTTFVDVRVQIVDVVVGCLVRAAKFAMRAVETGVFKHAHSVLLRINSRNLAVRLGHEEDDTGIARRNISLLCEMRTSTHPKVPKFWRRVNLTISVQYGILH
jgi:hypothetical protein